MKTDLVYVEKARKKLDGVNENIITGWVSDGVETRKFTVKKVSDMRIVIARFYAEKARAKS